VTGPEGDAEPSLPRERSAARRKYEELPSGTRRWLLLWAFLRPSIMVVSLLLLYYLLPLWDRHVRSAAVSLTLGMVLVAVLLIWQIRKITTSKYPRLRAIEALALTAPLFILTFATVYFATGQSNRDSFSQVMSRTDSLYFTVTVFSSVGFGDIVPVTEAARVMVIIQMLGDLVLIGIVARVILGAVQSGLRRAQSGTPAD
jgi:voltage-gated potassium channel